MIPYLIGLDRQITARFEGKRWELPARVYGRALELFPGKVLHPDLLEKELELLHYIQQKFLQKTGEYSRDTEGFALNTRGFHFPDEKQHPRSDHTK
ncbi:MAG: hypothetical protein GQ559_09670 [Desulfobulbaceae bacterium]|nr:hypothetical protein [Desulfobulbaceae bacterium]